MAGWSRSSSGMRWWGCSGCPRRMRMIRSGRCGRGFGSWRRRRSSRASVVGRLQLRVGINTGEALVRLGVSALSGEGFLTGDAVNTAARIQSVAPVMGCRGRVATYEATKAVFDYEELEPAELKGKAEPVRVFHAKARPRPARDGSDADAREPVRRAGDRPGVAEGDLRQGGRGGVGAARDGGGGAGAREEPDRRRAGRVRRCEAGSA